MIKFICKNSDGGITMSKVLRLLKPHIGPLLGSIFFSLVSTVMQILLPV